MDRSYPLVSNLHLLLSLALPSLLYCQLEAHPWESLSHGTNAPDVQGWRLARASCTASPQDFLQVAWNTTLRGALLSSPAVSREGLAFVGTGDINSPLPGFVHAVNTTDGRLRWSFSAPGSVWSSPVIGHFDDNVYVACTTGQVHALRRSTGALLWNYTMLGVNPYIGLMEAASTPASLLAAGGSAASASLLSLLIVGDAAGSLVALNATTGELKWERTLDGMIGNAPSISYMTKETIIYVGTYRSCVYAVSRSGEELWVYRAPAFPTAIIRSSPAVAQRSSDAPVLYFGDNLGSFYSVDALTGAPIWVRDFRSPELWPTPAVLSGGRAMVLMLNNSLTLYNVVSNELTRWIYGMDRCVSSPALALEGVSYVGGMDGYLYANGVHETGLGDGGRLFLGSAIFASPAIGLGGTVIVGTRSGSLFGIGCRSCSPGFAGYMCAQCTPGTYWTRTGSPCTPCPAGTFSTASGATSGSTCSPCAAGYGSPPGSSVCLGLSAASVLENSPEFSVFWDMVRADESLLALLRNSTVLSIVLPLNSALAPPLMRASTLARIRADAGLTREFVRNHMFSTHIRRPLGAVRGRVSTAVSLTGETHVVTFQDTHLLDGEVFPQSITTILNESMQLLRGTTPLLPASLAAEEICGDALVESSGEDFFTIEVFRDALSLLVCAANPGSGRRVIIQAPLESASLGLTSTTPHITVSEDGRLHIVAARIVSNVPVVLSCKEAPPRCDSPEIATAVLPGRSPVAGDIRICSPQGVVLHSSSWAPSSSEKC